MIKNDKQLQITKNRLMEFKNAIDELTNSNDTDIDPIFKKIQHDAITCQIIEFEKEIAEYELLKAGNVDHIYVNSLSNFYEALIKGRIIRGWTQAELARKLDLKEQQIQRYELCNYSTASIDKINQVASVLEIDMKPIKIKFSQPSLFAIPEGIDDSMILNALNKIRSNRSLLTFAN